LYAWDKRLSELADYRKIHGHCNVPTTTAKTREVIKPKEQLQVAPKRKDIDYDHLPNPGIGKLRFRNGTAMAPPEDRLSELADYRKIHAPQCSSKATAKTPAGEVGRQAKHQYKLHLEGKHRL
jgi:hypothetical protein